ncbi:MAG: methyltransferase [Patescibacteria group bacterium]
MFLFAAPLLSRDVSSKNRVSLPDDKLAKRQFYAIIFFVTLMHTAGFFGISRIELLPFFATPVVLAVVLGIFLVGIALAMMDRWVIRSLSFREVVFSINPEKNTSGTYRFIKHPMYAGFTLAFLAFLLVYPTVVGLLSLLVILFIFVKRAQRE